LINRKGACWLCFVATIERASILFSLRFTNPGGNATNSRYAPKVVPAGVTVHAIGMAPAELPRFKHKLVWLAA
jgi:hypothetical protein